MARVKNNKLTEGISGQFHEQFVFRTYGDKTFLSRYPNMTKVKFNDKQKAEQSLFADAVAHARSIINDPEKKAALKATLEPGRKVFNAAVSAYLKIHKNKNNA